MGAAAHDLHVLVLAPVGRDARLLRDALRAADLAAEAVESIPEVLERMRAGELGALLLTEEVLDVANIGLLRDVLAHEPAWSDLPILILTVGGSATTLSRQRERERLPLGNPTLLERPIRTATLVSSVRSALRSRARQYQVRDTLLERDRAYEARRESESRLLTAIEVAKLGSWELNTRTGEIEASSTFRENFDFGADEPLVYSRFLARVHPDDRTELEERFARSVKNREAYSAEYRIVRPDGAVRWMSVNARFLEPTQLSPAGSGEPNATGLSDLRVAGVTLDVTERVLSEQALRQADKLALVGRLSSSIAHEINNPLESVTNLLYLLGSGELSDAAREYVTVAQSELARVSEIAAQTLTFNRQQNAYEEAVLSGILDSVLALYQGRLATSGIQVERRYTFRQAILCYPGEIRQVFTNLIGNAFDAMRAGGRILVRERFTHHPRTGEPGVRVTVADTGTGLAPAVRARLFEAFQSTKGNNGTGLGLWISRGIAQKHRGSLRFSSSTIPGHSGTVFALFIPFPPPGKSAGK